MDSVKRINFSGILQGVAALAVFVLVAYKASITSFTHDESFSYTRYVHQSFMEIISYADPYTNNHILNTLAMKYSEAIFGNSELSLRLGSIMAFAGFSVFIFFILAWIPLRLRFPFFLILLLNPYLLDFFGLARGYSLSIFCMVASVYCAGKWLEIHKPKWLLWFSGFLILAAVSNFSLINYYVAAVFMIILLDYKTGLDNSVFKRSLWIHFISFVSAFAILYEPIRKISKQHMLDFGGKSDIVTDTFYSLVQATTYHHVPGHIILLSLSWLIAIMIILFLSTGLRLFLKKQHIGINEQRFIFCTGSLVIIICCTIVQHYLLKNDYFVGRFALFLLPLFVLNLALFSGILRNKLQKFSFYFFSFIALVFILNLAINWNMKSYLDWEYDMDTKSAFENMQSHNSTIHDQPGRIGLTWYFEPTINFYRETRQAHWLEKADREGLKESDLYFYCDSNEIINFPIINKLMISKTGAVLTYNRSVQGN
jgi:hypothetical protein